MAVDIFTNKKFKGKAQFPSNSQAINVGADLTVSWYADSSDAFTDQSYFQTSKAAHALRIISSATVFRILAHDVGGNGYFQCGVNGGSNNGSLTFSGINGSDAALITFQASNTVATGSFKSSSATAGIGYATGAGGTVTQATSKSTGVTINKVCGNITMNGAALAAGTIVSFTVSNTAVEANDLVVLNHLTGGTLGAYTVNASSMSNGTFQINVRNNTAGSLSEAIVIRFAIIKAAVS